MTKLLEKIIGLITWICISCYLVGTIGISMSLMMSFHPIAGIATFVGGVTIMGEILGRRLADILVDKEKQ